MKAGARSGWVLWDTTIQAVGLREAARVHRARAKNFLNDTNGRYTHKK